MQFLDWLDTAVAVQRQSGWSRQFSLEVPQFLQGMQDVPEFPATSREVPQLQFIDKVWKL